MSKRMIGTSNSCYCISSRSQSSGFFLLLGVLMYFWEYYRLFFTSSDESEGFYHGLPHFCFLFIPFEIEMGWSIENAGGFGINLSLSHLIYPIQLNKTFLYWSSDVFRKWPVNLKFISPTCWKLSWDKPVLDSILLLMYAISELIIVRLFQNLIKQFTYTILGTYTHE